jgi:hypothetical protein
MNRLQLTTAALSFSDRNYSDEVIANMSTFIKLVEAKINRRFRAEGLTKRSHMHLFGKEYYCLPVDYNGMIDIVYKESTTSISRKQVVFREQEYINAYANVADVNDGIAYNITANQLHVMPSALDTGVFELIHYIKVPALATDTDTNKISEDYPDCYLKGILAEIYDFVKDFEASLKYAQEFSGIVDEIIHNDYKVTQAGSRMHVVSEDSI